MVQRGGSKKWLRARIANYESQVCSYKRSEYWMLRGKQRVQTTTTPGSPITGSHSAGGCRFGAHLVDCRSRSECTGIVSPACTRRADRMVVPALAESLRLARLYQDCSDAGCFRR